MVTIFRQTAIYTERLCLEQRSEEDGATVKLVYENRGEKLSIARLDLNDRIAARIEQAELDPDRDTADVTDLLKALHRIVNDAIRAQQPGDDQTKGLTFDLSRIDLERLHDEFAKKVRRKATVLHVWQQSASSIFGTV